MGQKLPRTQRTSMSSSYTTTNAWANVTGLVLTALESGFYNINASYAVYNDAAADRTYTRLAINGNAISRTESETYQNNSVCVVHDVKIIQSIYLKKGDIVSLQAIYAVSSTQIYISAGNDESYLEIVKAG